MAGYNTELMRHGASYHIQTQDKGPQAPYIETIIYKSGRVLSTRRTSYTRHLGQPEFKETVLELLERQHQAILNDISAGKFDHR